MAADDYHLDLVRCTAEELALAYQLVTGKASKGVSKAAMVSALGNAFDRRCIGCHAKYLASLPTEQKHAVDEYRGSGYIYMNYALRTGRMKVMLNWWQLSERLSTVDLTTTPGDVTAFAKSPTAFARKLFRRSKLDEVVASMVAEAVQASAGHWKLLESMVAAVSKGPRRAADSVLWRGEAMLQGFSDPEPAQVTQHAHSEKVKALQPGDVFVRPDFASFSMSPVIAARFAGSGCCMYRLTLRRAHPALFMESYSRPKEYEVILPPGTRFEVTGRWGTESMVSRGVAMTVFDLVCV
jgi:hypothetical protein